MNEHGTEGGDTVVKPEDLRDPQDTVRRVFRPLTPEQERNVAKVKMSGEDFIAIINGLGHSREFSLAITKIEEAVMWGVKGATAR